MIKIFSEELKLTLENTCPDGPVVIASSLWPLLRQLEPSQYVASTEQLFFTLIELLNERGVFFPCFGEGYHNGIFNIKTSKILTGKFGELARLQPNAVFNPSAFFPFAGFGNVPKSITNIQPKNAWGDGSIYEYFEDHNVTFLNIGTHPTQISYLHRFEWLARNVWSPRQSKEFSGIWVCDKSRVSLTENLFVRPLAPELINDFTTLLPYFRHCTSFTDRLIQRTRISTISATDLINTVYPIFQMDPKCVVRNAQEFP